MIIKISQVAGWLLLSAIALTARAQKEVPQAVMQKIYEEVKTPYKYGLVVASADPQKKTDCPTVFRKGDLWYMTYIVFDGRGYETWLAQSTDLLHWITKGRLLSFRDTTQWDGSQKAGYPALQDNTWGGSYALQPYNGKYWMSYFGGREAGYEAGLLSLGMAYTTGQPTVPHEWQRLPQPILTSKDADVRWWENKKQFKSSVIWDKQKKTGYPFVMYYNANGDSAANNIKTRWYERIGMAVSNDMVHWKRFDKEPVMHHPAGITGDAVIQKINDVWVMFYFGAFWTGRKDAFNRFACSYDLVHWTDWNGDDLINSTRPYDERFAHKSFVVKYKGVVYHFYNAVDKNDQRGIAVATSIDKGTGKLQFPTPPTGRTVTDFNDNWQFQLAADSAAAVAGYQKDKWRAVTLPHDWSIEGSFSEKHPASTQGGALPGGTAWYQKTFTSPAGTAASNVYIEFDGVYRNSEVWINGHYLGKRPYGYSSFRYALTPYLHKDQANTLLVKVDNSQQPNSRWYTGSGIYRNVRLVMTGEVAIDHWGSFVTTPVIHEQEATVNVALQIRNTAASVLPVTITTTLVDSMGMTIATKTTKDVKLTDIVHVLSQSIALAHPRLWSVDRPYLYKAVTTVLQQGKKIDEYTTTFGVRYFRFDADKGFFLNGNPLKVLGVCMHHDLGALGAAINKTAIRRQLQSMKDMGANAIRTAHNPPAPEVLDLCDEMGLLVIDESYDMWRKKKNKYDYYADFPDWHQRDLEDMVKRDRNHPSVFIWSIGNEIREQFDSTGITIARELVNIVKQLDTTRLVTAALSEWDPKKNFMYQSGALDIVGLNYHHEVYADFQKHYPGKAFIGTENMSALATRGHYDLPSDTMKFWPQKSPMKYVEVGNADYTVSAYDQVAAYWGSSHETTWKIIKKHDFLSGLFVWTGWDYLGEPVPYPWPARSSYYGIVDLAGFPKDVYYMYQSEWTKKPVLHVFPHWNWKPGQLVDIWAYYSQADEVELFVNGRSLGVKHKEGEELHVMWRVPFEAGVVKAVSRKNGKIILVKEVRTAGKPAQLVLKTDRKIIQADGKDLAFVTMEVQDANGNIVPDAANLISINITGGATLAGMDNGYQASLESFKGKSHKAWKGLCMAIIQAGGQADTIRITASANGLRSSTIVLKTQP